MSHDQQRGVFKLQDDIARFQAVDAGVTQGGEVEVISGLKEGEVVITLGVNLVKNGDKVRLRSEKPSGTAQKSTEEGGCMKLVEFSINRPVTTYMMIATILLLGVIAFFRLPVDLMPEMEFPTLTVATTYQGVAPEEMETLITRPIEEAVGALAGVEKIRSSSSEGQSSVRISFTWGTDLNEAASDVRTRLDRLRRILPEDADPPTLFKFDTTQFPIMFLAVASSEMDALALRHLMEDQLQYRLERVPGVAAAEIRGGLRREIHVDMFLEKLRALNISPEEVTTTLTARKSQSAGWPG